MEHYFSLIAVLLILIALLVLFKDGLQDIIPVAVQASILSLGLEQAMMVHTKVKSSMSHSIMVLHGQLWLIQFQPMLIHMAFVDVYRYLEPTTSN